MSISSNSLANKFIDNDGINALNLCRLQLNAQIEACCRKHDVDNDIKKYLMHSLIVPEPMVDFAKDVEKAVLAYVDLFGDSICSNDTTFLGSYDKINTYSLLNHDFLGSDDSACGNSLMEYATISALSRIADPDQADMNSSPSFKKSLNSADIIRPFEIKFKNEVFQASVKGVFCESVTGSSPSGLEAEASIVLNDDMAAEIIADTIESFIIDSSNSSTNDRMVMDALLGINSQDGRKAVLFITEFESTISGEIAIDSADLLQTTVLLIAKYLEAFNLDEMNGRSAIGKEVTAGPLSLSGIILNPAIAEMCDPNFRNGLINRLRKYGKSTRSVKVFNFPQEVRI